MTSKLLLFAGFVISMLLMSFNYNKKKKRILFFGDSITEQGLKRGGYIDKILQLLRRDGEDEKIELIGAGIGGNKVYDLYLRMDEDVLAKGPHAVVVFIGVNDVWHKQLLATGTDIDKFEKFYRAIIAKVQASGSKVLLVTPAVIGEKPNGSNTLDEELDKYCDTIRSLAQENNLPLVDLRKSFLDYNIINNPENREFGILTTDGVHLNDQGNQLVADELWRALQQIKL